MRSSTTLLALAALISLQTTIAQPHRHGIQHAKRVDYSNPALYKDVDWNKVFQPASPPAQPSPQEDNAQPAAQPQKQEAAPKTETKAPETQEKATQSSSASGSKRGLVYNWESPSLDIFDPYKGKVSWAWNWDSTPFKLPNGYEFVPCLHANTPEWTGKWNSDAKKAISANGGKTTYLIGFNEPDIGSQANMDVGNAVGAWKQYMQPLAGGSVKLGSPQVSNGVAQPGAARPMGLDWLSSFMGSCGGCTVDFLVVHWYGCTNHCTVDTDVQSFKDFVNKAVKLGNGKKVWLTEFARAEGMGGDEDFLGKVLGWLDGSAGVERYSYFMVKDGSLTQGGGLSGVGKEYVS